MILLIGLLYILGFGALSFMRRQGLSTRFAIEGGLITGVAAALATSIPVNAVLFFIILYVITMRVRLLVDLGNALASKKHYQQTLDLYRFALRLGPDAVSRQIVLINRGVTQLRMQEPEAARLTLEAVLAEEHLRPGAKYMAAGYYNLGVACRHTGHEAEAIQHFNEAIDSLPHSIYAHAAQLALKKNRADAAN
ncbi:MAG: hypothetical protein DRI37_02230 [Chloroflexi bacterium]|nr:MAG: hypothetical protein DRI37_02230 [Chloroflexota bacterium]